MSAKREELRVSNEAVKAKTGKTWREWFSVLDAAGARQMGHTRIARYLNEVHGVPSWWSQTVANTYEVEKGLRERHQMPEGYEVSVSKTFNVPVETLYGAWIDERLREGWLPNQPFIIRKATEDKSLRITWVDGKTSVEVNLYKKGGEKAQLVVQHSKLPNATEAEGMKGFWREALERMASVVGV